MAFSSPTGGHCSHPSVQLVLSGRLLCARLVPGAVCPHSHLSHQWGRRGPSLPTQAFSSHNLSVRGKGLPSLSKHHLCFKPERGSGERPVTSHHSGSRGGHEAPGELSQNPRMRWQDMETPEARPTLTVRSEWLRPAFQQLPPQRGDLAAPRCPTWTYLFSCASQHCGNSKRLFLKMEPVPSRSLSHFVFFRPQTDDLTVKTWAREDRGCRQPAQEILLPSGVKPFDCIFQKTEQISSYTLAKLCIAPQASPSLMTGSSKGLMAARTLPGRQPHSLPERHSFCQPRCLSSPRSFVHFLKKEASPGEARRQKEGCVSCSFAFSRIGPGL